MLINQLESEQILTVERKNGETTFSRLSRKRLATWLETFDETEGYGLGELWEKNLLGGRP